jgi:hypothetical protein
MFRALTIAGALAAASPALANDTMAELSTGGLIFVRTDAVSIEGEDLYISPDAVRVSYVFRNHTETDVDSVVAFPMPDIQLLPYSEVSMPEPGSDNFLGFSVTADGKSISPSLDQRAFAAEVDVTAELQALGIPLNPGAQNVAEALQKLPPQTRKEWVARGLIVIGGYDDGSGFKEELLPVWKLKSTYWWRMTFPAGESVDVRHEYRPSVGGTSGISFFYDGKTGGPQLEEYRRKYCLDGAIERAVVNAANKAPDGYPPYWENWISYVLTTGANWATTIGRFTLTVDKGDPANLVSFCGSGVEKIGPTTFRLTYTDFMPEKDINILLLRRFDR